jgi:hypothetical protein
MSYRKKVDAQYAHIVSLRIGLGLGSVRKPKKYDFL